MTTERVHFRVVNMQCCNIVLCLVNSRFYNYCPECGKRCYPEIKQWVISDFPEAVIKYQMRTPKAAVESTASVPVRVNGSV